MPIPTCPKNNCNGMIFTLETISPHGSKYKLSAICCSSCGAVVGVLDYLNIGVKTEHIETRLKHLEALPSRIVELTQAVQQLAKR